MPLIGVRQPQPHDLVDDPVEICGVGTGFEGRFPRTGAMGRDGTGADGVFCLTPRNGAFDVVYSSIMAGIKVPPNFLDELRPEQLRG